MVISGKTRDWTGNGFVRDGYGIEAHGCAPVCHGGCADRKMAAAVQERVLPVAVGW